jgi:hypothetical protein
MKNSFLLLWLLAWVPVNTCTDNMNLKEITSYLNASDTAEKSRYMADNFHSFFMTKEGTGKNKSQALESFQNWDGPMHPDINIINYTSHDSIWTVTFNEQNDFTKPIDFPGWKGTITFVFNSKNLIEETVYVPDSTNLSYKPFLQPALEWLQKNMPNELNEVYKNGKLIQTEVAANKWRTLLQKWQSQKNDSNK